MSPCSLRKTNSAARSEQQRRKHHHLESTYKRLQQCQSGDITKSIAMGYLRAGEAIGLESIVTTFPACFFKRAQAMVTERQQSAPAAPAHTALPPMSQARGCCTAPTPSSEQKMVMDMVACMSMLRFK